MITMTCNCGTVIESASAVEVIALTQKHDESCPTKKENQP